VESQPRLNAVGDAIGVLGGHVTMNYATLATTAVPIDMGWLSLLSNGSGASIPPVIAV
jgi:hypothetical protein